MALVEFRVRRIFIPTAPVYINVTPQWLLEVRNRTVEELRQLKWYSLLGTRAFGITKEELVQCLKDEACLEALLRGICASVKTGNVKTKKKYLKSWLIFCIDYW